MGVYNIECGTASTKAYRGGAGNIISPTLMNFKALKFHWLGVVYHGGEVSVDVSRCSGVLVVGEKGVFFFRSQRALQEE